MTWKTTQGTQETKPLPIETSESLVYFHKDITRKTVTDEYGTHSYWEYQEVIVPKEDTLNITKYTAEINNIAITEVQADIVEAMMDEFNAL